MMANALAFITILMFTLSSLVTCQQPSIEAVENTVVLAADGGVVAQRGQTTCVLDTLCDTKASNDQVNLVSSNLDDANSQINDLKQFVKDLQADMKALKKQVQSNEDLDIKTRLEALEGSKILLSQKIDTKANSTTVSTWAKTTMELQKNLTSVMKDAATEHEEQHTKVDALESTLTDAIRSTALNGQLGTSPDPRIVQKVSQQYINATETIPHEGLELWLSADSLTSVKDGEEVTSWQDLSGNNVPVSAMTWGTNPVMKKAHPGMGGHPAVYFPDVRSAFSIGNIANIGLDDARTVILTVHHDLSDVHNGDASLASSEIFGINTGSCLSFSTWCSVGVDGLASTRAGAENIRFRDTASMGNDAPNYGSAWSSNGATYYAAPTLVTAIADSEGTEVFVNGKPVFMSKICTSAGDTYGVDGPPNYKYHKSDLKFFHFAFDKLLLGSTAFSGGQRGYVGDVGDVLVYSRALNRTERYLAELPFLTKYLRDSEM
eukprot:m.81683 g.81683  ORF g.81683 m.81683 type:complete len:491 (+) comp25441_c2_seq4:866-2338(+)